MYGDISCGITCYGIWNDGSASDSLIRVGYQAWTESTCTSFLGVIAVKTYPSSFISDGLIEAPGCIGETYVDTGVVREVAVRPEDEVGETGEVEVVVTGGGDCLR